MSEGTQSPRPPALVTSAVAEVLAGCPMNPEKGVLPSEKFSTLLNTLTTIVENPLYSIPAFQANAKSYGQEDTVIVALVALFKSQNSTLAKAVMDLKLSQEDARQKDETISDLQNNYEDIVNQAKKMHDASPRKGDIGKIERRLNDANERLSLMQQLLQQANSEKENLKTQLDNETMRTNQLEEDLGLSQNKLSESVLQMDSFLEVSQALGFEGCQTSDEILCNLRNILELPPESDEISDSLQNLTENNRKYKGLLRFFNISPNAQDQEHAIVKACEENLVYDLKLRFNVQSKAATFEDFVDDYISSKRTGFSSSSCTVFSVLQTEERERASKECQTMPDDEAKKLLAYQTQLATTYKEQNETLKKDLADASETVQQLKDFQKRYQTARSQKDEATRNMTQLKNALEDERKKCDETEEKYSKLNEQNAELQNQIDELTHVNSTLKETLQIQEEEREKNNSSQRISSAFSMALSEIDEQRKELTQLAKQKALCINLINKQMRLFEIYENQIQIKDQQIEDSTKEIPIIDEDDLFRIIVDLSNESDDAQIANITSIARSEGQMPDKIKMIMQSLINEVHASKEQDHEQFEHLLTLLNSQLNYIDAFTKDGEIPTSIKKQLLENVDESHKFITKYAKGLIEESSLFSLLDTDEDPEELKQTLNLLFETFPELETDKSTEIFVALRQAIAVISIFRRFCQTLQLQFSHQVSEIAKLKQELQENNETLDVQKDQLDSALEEKDRLNEMLQSIHVAISTRNLDPQLRSDIGQICDGKIDNYSIQRIKELEDNLNQTNAEFDDLQTEEMEQFKRHIDEQKNLIDQKNAELDLQRKEIAEVQFEFDKLKESSETLRQQCADLEAKNANLKMKYDTEKKQNAQLVSESAQQKGSLQAQIDKLAEDLNLRNEDNTHELEQKINALQSELKKANLKCEELSKSTEATKKKLDKLRDDNTQKHSELVRTREEGKQLDSQVAALEIENNILKARIGMIEERYRQQIEQYKDTFSVEIATKDAEFKAEKARCLEASEKLRSQFLIRITSVFRNKIDISKPLDEDSAIQVMEDVLCTEKKANQEVERLHDLDRQITEIRGLVKAPQGIRTVAIVQEIVNSKGK